MRRRNMLAGAAAMLSALSAAPLPAQGTGADRSAVQSLLAEYTASWQSGDAARMFASATPDIHWVNIVGMHWQGRADVELAHQRYFDTIFRGVPMTLDEIESVVPAGRDVLIVVARWNVGAFTTPAGFKAPASQDRMSLVLRRTADGLRIAHVANIQIDQRAAGSNPLNKPAP